MPTKNKKRIYAKDFEIEVRLADRRDTITIPFNDILTVSDFYYKKEDRYVTTIVTNWPSAAHNLAILSCDHVNKVRDAIRLAEWNLIQARLGNKHKKLIKARGLKLDY